MGDPESTREDSHEHTLSLSLVGGSTPQRGGGYGPLVNAEADNPHRRGGAYANQALRQQPAGRGSTSSER